MNLEWPPEKTFNYDFKEKEDLTLEIPLVGKNVKKNKEQKESKEQR
mgnify:CR=1 FL=1